MKKTREKHILQIRQGIKEELLDEKRFKVEIRRNLYLK